MSFGRPRVYLFRSPLHTAGPNRQHRRECHPRSVTNDVLDRDFCPTAPLPSFFPQSFSYSTIYQVIGLLFLSVHLSNSNKQKRKQKKKNNAGWLRNKLKAFFPREICLLGNLLSPPKRKRKKKWLHAHTQYLEGGKKPVTGRWKLWFSSLKFLNGIAFVGAVISVAARRRRREQHRPLWTRLLDLNAPSVRRQGRQWPWWIRPSCN